MQIYPIADIVGDNAVHALLTDTSKKARVVYLTAVSGPARVGDSTVGAAKGVQIPTNTTLTLVLDGDDITSTYELADLSAYVPAGTTLTISYAL